MALLHVCFRSAVLELDMRMSVILPETKCAREGGRWPTLYLLHGLSDDHTAWERRTSIERYASRMGLAIVMPEVYRSFYTDMKHGGRYWTFISEELPTLCENMFLLSDKREDRFAAGLSMGGYGAFKLGLRLPERYAAVASLSGAVDLFYGADVDEKEDKHADLWSDIFGTAREAVGGEDDLPAVARRLIQRGGQRPMFYLACGTEDFLYEGNQRFLKEFGESLQIAYKEGPGGHTWGFWDQYIQDVLTWLPIA